MSTNQESLSQFRPEVSQPSDGNEEQLHNNVEAATPKEKDTRQPVTTMAQQQDVPPVAATTPVIPATPPVPHSHVQPKSPIAVADDVDLIEKEWVDRAKAIVEATQDNPRKQKSEISKVKAEYIQKRFNKTIKVDSAA
jgi:hypothetical protein